METANNKKERRSFTTTIMPRPAARLSNCYVPLPLPSMGSKDDNIVALRSSRGEESRSPHSLRRLCLETSVTKALGSTLVEMGHTKVLCEVNVTTTDFPSSTTINMEEGTLLCKVQFAPHVGVDAISQQTHSVTPLESTISAGKLNSQTMTREVDLSYQLTSALLPAIPLDKFPKCVIVVKTTILQDDGSALSACITAASIALADARVELYDLVTSCTVAVVKDGEGTLVFLADPTQLEISRAQAVMCLAMLPNHKEVTLWSQSGRLTSSMANEAMDLSRNGCKTMHKFMRETWISKQGGQ
jgi:exosome complex component MTR3